MKSGQAEKKNSQRVRIPHLYLKTYSTYIFFFAVLKYKIQDLKDVDRDEYSFQPCEERLLWGSQYNIN